jgi:hypothetical protein
MMDWFRTYHDMVTDPKWRTVAKRAGQPVHKVVCIWVAMLTYASKAKVRGTLEGWDHEDIAVAFDMEVEEVASIYQAMQGKTLDGNRLTGWDERQPKRERDDETATERKRRQRDREKDGVTEVEGDASRHVTPCHATSLPRGEERREEGSVVANAPTDAGASDLKAIVWKKGLSWLADSTGKSPDALRGMMGKWCKDYGDGRVIEVMAQAQSQGALADPIGWITARLIGPKPRASPARPNPERKPSAPAAGSPEWKAMMRESGALVE